MTFSLSSTSCLLKLPITKQTHGNMESIWKLFVLLKAGPRPSSPVLIFHSFLSSPTPRTCTDLHRLWGATWTTVSLNSFTIESFEPFDDTLPPYRVRQQTNKKRMTTFFT